MNCDKWRSHIMNEFAPHGAMNDDPALVGHARICPACEEWLADYQAYVKLMTSARSGRVSTQIVDEITVNVMSQIDERGEKRGFMTGSMSWMRFQPSRRILVPAGLAILALTVIWLFNLAVLSPLPSDQQPIRQSERPVWKLTVLHKESVDVQTAATGNSRRSSSMMRVKVLNSNQEFVWVSPVVSQKQEKKNDSPKL